MPRPQTAIIPDHAQAGIFIEADIRDGRYDDIKTACRSSLEALAKLKTRFPEDILGMDHRLRQRTHGKAFGHAEEGSEIKPFPVMGNGLAPQPNTISTSTSKPTAKKPPSHSHNPSLPRSATASASPLRNTACACMKTADWTALSMALKTRKAMKTSAMSPLSPKADPMPAQLRPAAKIPARPEKMGCRTRC